MCDPMGTVPDGCEVSRRGLSPLDQLPAAPLGTQYPVVSPQEMSVTGCRLPVGSSQSPMALAVNF